MRIALVVMSFTSGGAETLVRNLAAELTNRGHRCHLIAICAAESIGNSPEFEDYYRQFLIDHGISFEVLGWRMHRKPFRGANRLRNSVRRFQPDVLHVHTAHGLLFQLLSFLRVPTIYTHHNSVLKFPPWLFLAFDRVVDRYIAICRPCLDLLRRHVRQPISLIYNGVPAIEIPLAKRIRPPHDPVILGVGNLTPQKDYGTMIKAAAVVANKLATENRRSRLVIAGEGLERPTLSRQIEGGRLEDKVSLLGARSDIPELMNDAALMVNSSIYEGLPIALIEALQAGLPCVVTNVGGNPELVEDGKNGFVVPSGDPARLAERVVEVLSDAALYEKLARAAVKSAQRFSLEACADHHMSLYMEAMSDDVPLKSIAI